MTFALYANALANDLLADDTMIIGANPTIANPTAAAGVRLWTAGYWQGIRADGSTVWLTDDHSLYRPVTIGAFWLNALVAHGHPWAFRIVNATLHAAAAFMVGWWCAEWFGLAAGVVASGVFVMHPVASDVINRMTGRADILMVLGTAGFLTMQRMSQSRGWNAPRLMIAALLAAVAMGAKESGIVLVPLVLVQAWLADRRMLDSVRERSLGTMALVVPVLLYFMGRSAAVPSVVSWHPGGLWDLTGNPADDLGFLDRIPIALTLAWEYVVTIVWPYPLLAFHFPPRVPTWLDWRTGAGLITVVLFAVTTTLLARRRHPLTVGLAWCGLTFCVVSQLLLPIGAYFEVRFAYMLLPGVAFITGWFFAHARVAARSRPFLRAVSVALAACAAVIVLARNAASHDDLRLAEYDVAHRPNDAGALIKLGGAYRSAGRMADAEAALTKATQIAPRSAQAWYELAEFKGARAGDYTSVRGLYEKALELNPTHSVAMIRLATFALNAHDLDRAEGLLRDAQRVAPDDPYVIFNLAVLDHARGRTDAAKKRLRDLLARYPDFPPAVRGLSVLEQADGADR